MEKFVEELAKMIAKPVAEMVAASLKSHIGNLPSVEQEPDRYLNMREACEELDITYPTLRKYVKLGMIKPAFKGTRTPRFLLSEVRNLSRQSVAQ